MKLILRTVCKVGVRSDLSGVFPTDIHALYQYPCLREFKVKVENVEQRL